nr:pre-rrna-processing protein fhl1 [Quercus suber]
MSGNDSCQKTRFTFTILCLKHHSRVSLLSYSTLLQIVHPTVAMPMHSICRHEPDRHRQNPRYRSDGYDNVLTGPPLFRISTNYEASSRQLLQEMETNTASTMAHQPVLLHNTTYEFAGLNPATHNENAHGAHDDMFSFATRVREQPVEARSVDRPPGPPWEEPVECNQEEISAETQLVYIAPRGEDDSALAAKLSADGSTYAHRNGVTIGNYSVPFDDPLIQNDMYSAAVSDEAIVDDPANESDSVIRANMRAYAKLVLPDGDFFITTPKLKVVRDMDCFREYQHGLKLAKRAQRELDRYAQEPSMPSQPGDGDQNGNRSSKSSQSLIGRPARALPSNFSEQGGAVAYATISEDEAGRRRRRKRKILSGKVSSAGSGSIAPASLHPDFNGIYGGGVGTQEEIQVLPVHPSIPADIVKISKEHLLFAYNNAEERWEVEVLGARCMVNDSQHIRGDIVPLNHDDEIMVVSLTIRFKLPDQRGHSPGISHGTFGDSDDFDAEYDEDEDLESDLECTPDNTPPFDFEHLGSEDDEAEAERKKVLAKSSIAAKKPKIKLKLKKKAAVDGDQPKEVSGSKEKAAKLSLKQHKKKHHVPETLCIDTEQREEKSRKLKEEPAELMVEGMPPPRPPVPPHPTGPNAPESTVESGNEIEAAQDRHVQPQNSPSIPPPVIEPGSIFEGVAPEEMPQKRKGPGRPPKNGLISKRDQSFVKRKIKEYEKRGEQPPPMDELVSIVRAENKAKEAAQKAAARGELVAEVMPSIEYDGHLSVSRQDFDHNQRYHQQQPQQQQQLRNENGDNQNAAPFDINGRPSSPRPKHVARSPSPIKPEIEFTEEEMKKPTMTYVHILDEVLKDHPNGKADLQEIYDRICKRYPYFKYKTTTSGWQSSVRHNLLQHGRFIESGRSGKGRLWAIDYNYDLSKEKKRKLTPPPRPPPQQMSHGNYTSNMQGQTSLYGQGNYQTPYGQPAQNGQPQHNGGPLPSAQHPYYSPYGPSNQGHLAQYPASYGQHGSVPHKGVSGPSQARGSQPSPANQSGGFGTSQSPAPVQSVPPPAAFQVVVNGIMRYRERYLAPYSQNTAAFKFHEDLFKKCTAFVSDIFHGQAASVDTGSFTSEEQRVFNELSDVVNRCKAGGGTPAAETSAPPAKVGTLSTTATISNTAATAGVAAQSTPASDDVSIGTSDQGSSFHVPSTGPSTGIVNQMTPTYGERGAHGPTSGPMLVPPSIGGETSNHNPTSTKTSSSAVNGTSQVPHATIQDRHVPLHPQPAIAEDPVIPGAESATPVPASNISLPGTDKAIPSSVPLALATPLVPIVPGPSPTLAPSVLDSVADEASFTDVVESQSQGLLATSSSTDHFDLAPDNSSQLSKTQIAGITETDNKDPPASLSSNKRIAEASIENETGSVKRIRTE